MGFNSGFKGFKFSRVVNFLIVFHRLVALFPCTWAEDKNVVDKNTASVLLSATGDIYWVMVFVVNIWVAF